MKTMPKNCVILGIIGVFSVSLATSHVSYAQSYPVKTNHFAQNFNGYPAPYGVNTGDLHLKPGPFLSPVPNNMPGMQNNFVLNSPYPPQYIPHPTAMRSHPHAGMNPGQMQRQTVKRGRYGNSVSSVQHYNGGKAIPKYDGFMGRLKGKKNLPYQVPAPRPAPSDMFQRWVEYEPQYTFHPGDQLDIVVASAPELSRTMTIGPDGRVNMPLVDSIMAAGRPLMQIQNDIKAQLAKQLVDPAVTVTPRAFAPAQIYVGGEVNAQGTYALPGPVGALEALIMAGGMRASAKSSQIAVLRRAPNGGMMMRSVNISNGIRNIREYNDNIQLRRGDIIFVPRTTLAEVGVFVQALRSAIPVDFNVSYNIGQGGGNDAALLNNGTTTTIVP